MSLYGIWQFLKTMHNKLTYIEYFKVYTIPFHPLLLSLEMHELQFEYYYKSAFSEEMYKY